VSRSGAAFELACWQGALHFSLLTLGILGAAYWILPLSNYFALMAASLLLPLLPLFWTGRRADLPASPTEQARPWLAFLSKTLAEESVLVQLWGRRPGVSGAGYPAALSGAPDPGLAARAEAEPNATVRYDEMRVRLLLKQIPPGLKALEVSLEEAAGACVLPCVIVRAHEESEIIKRLPSDIPWQRGRTAEERVAVLRPSAPTRAQLLRLLKTLLRNLQSAYKESPNSAARSAKSVDSAVKGRTPLAAPLM
jgi:hypothetical protein